MSTKPRVKVLGMTKTACFLFNRYNRKMEDYYSKIESAGQDEVRQVFVAILIDDI